jgi:hypothetical protein
LAQRFHTEGFEPLIDKTIIVRVYEARFQDVKERIFVAQGIPVVEQKLIFVAEVMDSQLSFQINPMLCRFSNA